MQKQLGMGRIHSMPAADCTRRDKLCSYQHLAEMYLLSQTRMLLGSSWSAVTEVAARLGGVPVQNACKPLSVDDTGKIRGSPKINAISMTQGMLPPCQAA